MRCITFLFLVACSGAPEAATEAPGVMQIAEAPTEEASAEGTPDELLARYSHALCRLYVEPECVSSQKSTCPTHIAFESMESCESFLKGTAGECEADAGRVLSDLRPKLAACEAALASHVCTETAFCGPEGKIDAVGACAEVAAGISAACPLVEDDQ
ncbi:MAG: hypothetical protein KC912_23950 [Proteobacteria bacterium]|nr:hypothetical protein [Pseudomonadota bacterium]